VANAGGVLALLCLLLAEGVGTGPAATVEAVDVHVGGIGFTSEAAIRRFLVTRAGEPLDEETLASDLRRLRTLGILYDVSAETGNDRLVINAKDRWSLVPFVGLRRGGGRTTARFGVSDHNVAGQLATAYGELSSNTDVPFVQGGALGSYVYFEVPRLFGTGLAPGLYWTREFIDFASFGTDGTVHYLYDRSRHDLRAELRYEFLSWLTASTGFETLHDRFNTSQLSRAPGVAPPDVDATFGFTTLSLGVVEQFVSQSSGSDLKFEVDASRRGLLGSTDGVVSGSVVARTFLLPRPSDNLVAQLSLQATDGRSDSFLFRSGGLREIRGFIDAFFQGQFMARANVEYRVDVMRLDFVVPAVAQVAAFTDGGYVARRAGSIAGLDYEGPISSIGAGVRYIPVPFARAVGRLDLALGLTPRRTFDISFGGQQFF
jgi:hypothetical protein